MVSSKRRSTGRGAHLGLLALSLLVPASLAVGGRPAEASPPSTPGPGQGAAPTAGDATVPDAVAPLAERIDAVLAAKFLQDAKVTVRAVDLATGKVVYERNPDLALNPASNAKLFTTAAALSTLGPEHRYVTRAWIEDGSLSGGVVDGPIYLEGGGDPALVTGDLYELAIDVRAAGVDTIKGGVVVDATRFDKDGLPPGFDQKDEFASYRAPLGACSTNFNTYVVVVHPGDAVGSPAEATVNPPVASIDVVNKVKTAEGTRNRVRVAVEQDGKKTTVTVTGTIGVDAARGSYRYPVSDPSQYAGEVFAVALRQAGVRFARTKVSTGELPDRVERMGIHRSATLGVLIRAVNKLSNNFMAEQILRTLGGSDAATAAASLDRLRTWTQEIEVPQAGLALGNGSGLYDNNRISAAQMTHMLARMYADFRYRADYLASFAVMGVDGTTRTRLDESAARRWIRAKTGTLDGVSALSGYAGAPGRAPIAFSILMNDLGRWETGAARRVQNEIAEMLALELTRTKPD